MKIFKNKFFIIALSIAIFLTVFTSVLAIMGKTDPIKEVFNTIATPFRYIGVKIGEATEGFSAYFKGIDRLAEENESLREENQALESALAEMQATKEENARLREYLAVKETYPTLTLTDALIIATESDNYSTFLTLNRGSGDGVGLGMPVIVKAGVVGSVCEVGYSWCRVRVITEASAGVGAYVSRSGEIGIVCGDISLKDKGICKMTYLPEGADISVGDLIYTSGEGSVYPRDLYIGKVVSVRKNEYLRTVEAEVECAVDFELLRYVMVVIDFETVSDGEAE